MILLESPRSSPAPGGPHHRFLAELLDLYSWCLGLFATFAVLIAWGQPSTSHLPGLLLFGCLAAAAGPQKLPVPGCPGRRISLGYAFVLLGLLLLGLPEAMIIAALGGLTGSLIKCRERPRRQECLFNVAAWVLATAFAGQILQALGPMTGPLTMSPALLPVFAAVSLFFLTNWTLAAVALSLAAAQPVGAVWRCGLGGAFTQASAGAALALLMALAYRLPDRTLFYLSLPLAYALFTAYQATLERMDESRRHLEELAAADAAAASERQRYRELIEFIPEGYLVTDASGVIQEANAAAAKLFGATPQRLIGQQLDTFVLWEERPPSHVELARLSQGSRPDWAVHLQPCQGPPLAVLLSVAAIRDAQGPWISLRWLVREVPEPQRAPEAIQRPSLERAAEVPQPFPEAG